MPAPRNGLDAAGPHGTELHSTGLHGTGLTGFGLAGTGPAGTGLASTRPDDAETTPLPVLTGTPPLGFESQISRLARLTPISNGKPHDDAADDGLADNGMADIRPPSHSRRRIPQAASAAAGRPPGVARGLLMTPWFAAASGFVIAASLWIHSSHPQLTYPAIAVGPPPCSPGGCSPPAEQQGAGSLPINSGQPPQHKPATAARKATRDQARTAAPGLSFRYVEHPAADGDVILTVVVTGKRPVKDWHLVFVLARDQIQNVFGADWTGKGTDRVAASPWTGDPSQQGGGRWHAGDGLSYQGAGQGGYRDGHGGALDHPVVFFTVVASGKPVGPTGCSFNGKSCTFHELSGASKGGR